MRLCFLLVTSPPEENNLSTRAVVAKMSQATRGKLPLFLQRLYHFICTLTSSLTQFTNQVPQTTVAVVVAVLQILV